MFKNARGFTLIELAVALAVLALALTLALPSWQRVTDRHRMISGVRQVSAFLSTAQTGAIERNARLSLAFQRNSEEQWCLGAVLGDAACDCMEDDIAQADFCAIDSVAQRVGAEWLGGLRLLSAADLQPDPGDGRIVFDPVIGILEPTGDRLELEFSSTSGAFLMTLSLSPTGLLNLCSPADSDPVPGYPTCTG